MSFRSLIIAALFAGGLWVASAQELTKEIRVLGYGDGLFGGIKFDQQLETGVSVTELSFLPNRKSRRYKLTDEVSELSFYREVPGPRESTQKVETGRIRWPSGAERALLVFFEPVDFAETGRYEILVLDESPDIWKAGCVRFLNLSGAELQCAFGATVLDLPREESEIFWFDPENTGAMRLQLTVPWQGERRTVYSTRFSPDPNHGKLLVIKPPLELGDFRVRLENLW